MEKMKNLDEKTTKKKVIKKTIKAEVVDLDQYSEEKLNLALYYEVVSTVYHSLSNLIVRKAIINDDELIKILQLQIANLFFLEKELKELKNKMYAKEFLQIIANLTMRDLTITKSSAKNRIEILEERNLLIVSVTNICKNVERESLEKIIDINDNSFVELSDQIAALNNFSPNDSVIDAKNAAFTNNVNNARTTTIDPLANNLDSASLANLSKMGILPQHPSANVKFYPYISKPKYIPFFKKILAGFLILSGLLFATTHILALFVKGDILIKDGGKSQHFNLGQNSGILWLLGMILILFIYCVYLFIKPPKLSREQYRTSYFLLIFLIVGLIAIVFSVIALTTDAGLNTVLKTVIGKDDKVDSQALDSLKNLSNFATWKIFSYVAGAFAIAPLIFTVLIIILNPKIDRNKLIKANNEYQKAVTSALKGENYEIDGSLFDENLENAKNKNSHKFWSNSDVFK